MKTRLKELRLKNGYTQQDIASVITCATSTYAHYEKDERWMDRDTLLRLATFYGVSIDYILCND